MSFEEDILQSREIYISLMQKIDAQRQEVELNLQQPVQLKACQICLQMVDQNNFIMIKGVMHDICIPCFKNYLNHDIINKKVERMICPHCMEQIGEDVIAQYVDNSTFQKYKQF